MIAAVQGVFERAGPLSDLEQAALEWVVTGKKRPREGAWEEKHDRWLRSYVEHGCSRKEIAEAMDRTNMSVRKRIQSLRRSGFIEAVK